MSAWRPDGGSVTWVTLPAASTDQVCEAHRCGAETGRTRLTRNDARRRFDARRLRVVPGAWGTHNSGRPTGIHSSSTRAKHAAAPAVRFCQSAMAPQPGTRHGVREGPLQLVCFCNIVAAEERFTINGYPIETSACRRHPEPGLEATDVGRSAASARQALRDLDGGCDGWCITGIGSRDASASDSARRLAPVKASRPCSA